MDKSGNSGSWMLRGKPGIGAGVGESAIEIPTDIGKELIRYPVSLFPIQIYRFYGVAFTILIPPYSVKLDSHKSCYLKKNSYIDS